MNELMILAEIGSNVFPFSRDRMEAFVIAASEAGADAVKVQLYRADHFPEHERASKAATEFPRVQFMDFVSMAHAAGLRAGASVFDEDAVDLVAKHGDFIKLATREQDNATLIFASRATGLTVLRSVSCSRLPTGS